MEEIPEIDGNSADPFVADAILNEKEFLEQGHNSQMLEACFGRMNTRLKSHKYSQQRVEEKSKITEVSSLILLRQNKSYTKARVGRPRSVKHTNSHTF